jgi:hypothetical protein
MGIIMQLSSCTHVNHFENEANSERGLCRSSSQQENWCVRQKFYISL